MLSAFARAFYATLIAAVSMAVAAEPELGALVDLYKDFHAHPELSLKETRSASRIAERFRAAGLTVTEGVGGHGVVGVLKNGAGPTVLIRGDMDALPVTEKTGLDYASEVTVLRDDGTTAGVMHACGHDVHMTVLVGTVERLARTADAWRGTLVAIAQPAEEIGAGARAMLADGLFRRFPRPDYNLALHVSSDMAAGTLGYTSGYATANVDSVDVIVHGVGGHGAWPSSAKDPVVLAANIVTGLQTLVSRTVHPLDPAVVTVGAIHGGTKRNIIPDRVDLALTVRSYSDEVRAQLIDGIARVAHGEALAFGIPEDLLPEVVTKDNYTPAGYNDPALVERIVEVFETAFGADNVVEKDPTMGGEDFARYGREGIPSMMFRLGAALAARVARHEAGEGPLPSLHSPTFFPDPEPTIATGVEAMTLAAQSLFEKPE